jgi:hypothetical protein
MAADRASGLAERQSWAIARWQLRSLGFSESRIRSWLATGRLHTRLPGVYVWGRPTLDEKGEHAAALLFAGRGSVLTGVTALWWQELLGDRPRAIHVDAPGRSRSRGCLRIHHPTGQVVRHDHEGLPVATLPRALLLAAGSLSHNALRHVLARADFKHILHLQSLHSACRGGAPGSRALRAALASHLPQLAMCANDFEIDFVLLCEAHSLPIPEPNTRIGRYRPDMLWRDAWLIVELDGDDAHSSAAQLIADVERQRWLEARGFTVIRFTWTAVQFQPELVAEEVRRALRHVARPAGE